MNSSNSDDELILGLDKWSRWRRTRLCGSMPVF